jgi:hypothetical protein
MLVRLERHTDQTKPCCENLATIHPDKGPHAAELKCSVCGQHRGWLPQEALDFVNTVAARVGAQDPVVLRDNTIGDNAPDYTGQINVDGVEHRLGGWAKVSKNGVKYLSLSIRAKEEEAKPSNDDVTWVP